MIQAHSVSPCSPLRIVGILFATALTVGAAIPTASAQGIQVIGDVDPAGGVASGFVPDLVLVGGITPPLQGTIFLGPSPGGNLTVGGLTLGRLGTGVGEVSVLGSSVLTVLGPNASTGTAPRDLIVGDWGTGRMTVAGGGTVNFAVGNSLCVATNCNALIGAIAGSSGTLSIRDPGSSVTLSGGGSTLIGFPAVYPGYGTSGGNANAQVNVTGGGRLDTHLAVVASGPRGTAPAGTETSTARVVVDGAGSVWNVTRNPFSGAQAGLILSDGTNATSIVDVTNGGRLSITGTRTSPATDASLPSFTMSPGGGTSTLNVNGGGSVILNGDTGVFNVGRSGGGQATVNVASGGTIAGGSPNGLMFMTVGRDGATGRLNVDGAGSSVTVQGVGGVNTQGLTGFGGTLQVGRGGPVAGGPSSTGTVGITNGGRITIGDGGTPAPSGGPGLQVGLGNGSSGSVSISGPGSRLEVVGGSAGSIATAQFGLTGFGSSVGPGNGSLTVSNGGQFSVTGLRDARIELGVGAGSTGTLSASGGAVVSAARLSVGSAGGTGNAAFDAARLNLAGTSVGSSGNAIGPTMIIGSGGGSGTVTLRNGSIASFSGSTPTSGILIGGTPLNPGGTGSLDVTGGSAVTFQSTMTQTFIQVGATAGGSGRMTVDGGSQVRLSNDGSMVVARAPTSTGTLLVQGSSTVDAGAFFGVSHDGTASTGGNGTATFAAGSTLVADEIRIGTGGTLRGSGTHVGNLILDGGVLDPGFSPGRMVFDGGFDFLGGQIILEIASDGAGGFLTDEIVFTRTSTLDLTGLNILFSFLGGADPEAFRSSGDWVLDTFFRTNASPGISAAFDTGISALGSLGDLFAMSTYAARSDAFTIDSFAFDSARGVTDLAVVPTPGTVALLGVALLGWGCSMRRRHDGRRARHPAG
jgi:hypothetical protein